MAQIELRNEGSVEEGWMAKWSLDGVAAGTEIRIGAADSARLAAEGRRFLALFEQGVRPLVEPTVLSSLGAELARIWLDPVHSALGSALGSGGGELIIAGNDARALDLPWELIELHPGLPVGCDTAWTLRREAIADGVVRSNMPQPPPGGGPLRILFLASAPEDQDPLDLEREEDLVLRPTEGLRGEVIVHIAEVGTFAELRRLAERVKPQVIHLSGHGDLNSKGEGVFAFETEEGATDLRTAETIVEEVVRSSSVQLFVLNACKSALSGTAGLCRALAAAGVPHALGWAASVEDGVGRRFVTKLYGDLMSGASVGRAVAHARQELRDQGRMDTNEGPKLDASFALSQLYGRGEGDLIDPSKPIEKYDGPSTEYALLGDGVKGLKEGFIGRRRDVWKLLKAMRRGEPTVALLWGIGGAGKSTLATRVANRLQEDGFHILPVRAPDGDDPAAIGRETHSKLMGAIELAFEKAGREDLLGILRSEKIPPEQRLRLAVEGLCEIRALLVLDNLEAALQLKTRQIVDPALASFLELLVTELSGGSRLLITCRYEIVNLDRLGLLGLEVKDFHSSDIRKFFRRDEKVEERLHCGEIPLWLFDRLAMDLGGTPRFLETVRIALRTADPEDFLAGLDGLEFGSLAEKRREYLEKILAQKLYEALSPGARRLASRLAVSELPLPLDGVARIAGCGVEESKLALGEGVAYGLLQSFEETELPTLYHPPGLLRSWLLEVGLGEEEVRETHAEIARFWRESYEKSREREMRVVTEVELSACRFHAKASGQRESFGWATVQLADSLEGRAEWSSARAMLEQIPQPERRAIFWDTLAKINIREGLYDEARENLGQSLAMHESMGNRVGVSLALFHLGTIELRQGSYVSAREKLEKALGVRRSIGDNKGEAAAWLQLGTIDAYEGRYRLAREKLVQALAIQKEIGDSGGAAATIANLGSIDIEEGSYDSAREMLEYSLALRQSGSDPAGEAEVWHQLGSIDVIKGSYGIARNELGRALVLQQRIGDRSRESSTWHQLGTIDLKEGNYTAAREKFARSLSIKQALGHLAGEAATWAQLGTMDLEEGSYVAAWEKLGKALGIQQEIGDRAGEATTWGQLGLILFRNGITDLAARFAAFSVLAFSGTSAAKATVAAKNLAGVCKRIGYGDSEIRDLLAEAQAEYAKDRGHCLLMRAVGDLKIDSSEGI